MAIKTDTLTGDGALEGHSSDVGGGWSGADTTHFDITSGEVAIDASAAYIAMGDEAPTSADYWDEVNGTTVGTAGVDAFGPAIRALDTDNYYFGRIRGTGEWQLMKKVATTVTVIDSGSISGFSASTYYDIKIEANGTTLNLWIDSVKVTSDPTDSALSGAGEVSIYERSTNVLITSLDSDYVAAAGIKASPLTLMGVGI